MVNDIVEQCHNVAWELNKDRTLKEAFPEVEVYESDPEGDWGKGEKIHQKFVQGPVDLCIFVIT